MTNIRREVYDQSGKLLSADEVPITTEDANERSLLEKANAAIARMTEIANAESFTAAQLQQAVKDEAKAIRALIRLQLRRLDAAE